MLNDGRKLLQCGEMRLIFCNDWGVDVGAAR
jgi:hypothetical protein|nr:MAG TPA: hypothetical protein [Caudoviricetes sp.]